MKKNNIIYMPVGEIQFSPLNPRKTMDEAALNELAMSIQENGVIQPIIVRPLADEKHEVVCGERRLRASIAVGQETIPVIVRDLTDDQSMDMAITENLQRKDVNPLEEAVAFKILVEKGQNIADLAIRFGKSEIYIRGRLKLNDLIPEFVEIINSGRISVSHGLELCKYRKDLQQEIYNNCYDRKGNTWEDYSARELRRSLRQYQVNLEDAKFDKNDCFKCPDNMGCSCLFPEQEKVCCNNKSCFRNKTIEHLKNEAMRIFENEPEVVLFANQYQMDKKDPVVAFILEKGISVECNEGWDQVRELKKPEREDYDEDGDGEEEHRKALKKFSDTLKQYGQDIQDGKIRKAFVISGYAHVGEYLYIKMNARTLKKAVDESGKASKASQLTELREKDSRNNEIAFEKTLAEAKSIFALALDENRHTVPISGLEEKILYLHMLGDIRRSHRKQFDSESEYGMSEEEKFKVVEDLTEEKKVIILRDFLFEKLSGLTSKKNRTGELFLEWMKSHEPEKFTEIELQHRETYLRRKEKIDARVAEIELENMKI